VGDFPAFIVVDGKGNDFFAGIDKPAQRASTSSADGPAPLAVVDDRGAACAEMAVAIGVVDTALKERKFQDHIGLHHVRIHALEEAPSAAYEKGEVRDDALKSADFLFKNAPFITPHLRHMPAHAYLLTGKWKEVIQANTKATEADEPWLKNCGDPKAPGCNQLLVGHYRSHDMLFLAVGYADRGQWDEVAKLSKDFESTLVGFIEDQEASSTTSPPRS
jgi:hypothetical protein